MRAMWSLLFLSACANQFEADYELTGSWAFSEMKGTTEGCAEAFVTALEDPVTLTGSFPEFESTTLTDGSITILGETIDLEIEAATAQDTSRGTPVDPEATYDSDGTSWGLEYVSYETKHSCADCKDEIVVRLTSSANCYPWPVYQP